jgi:large subunit ribosomal protein L28
MSQRCDLCGKGPHSGFTFTRRGLAKAKGGVGRKVTGHTKRTFRPNIQTIKTMVNGTVKRMRVCAKCLRTNKLVKVA